MLLLINPKHLVTFQVCTCIGKKSTLKLILVLLSFSKDGSLCFLLQMEVKKYGLKHYVHKVSVVVIRLLVLFHSFTLIDPFLGHLQLSHDREHNAVESSVRLVQASNNFCAVSLSLQLSMFTFRFLKAFSQFFYLHLLAPCFLSTPYE